MTNKCSNDHAPTMTGHWSLSLGHLLVTGIWALFICMGCERTSSQELVLYTSVDQPYADPIVREFENRTGIRVRLVTDTEATKSVGLTERLRAEKEHPQCDVWWGNEPFNTINLAAEGLLQPYDSPSATDVFQMYKDPDHRWAGNGLRARVIVSFAAPAMPAWPQGLLEFADIGAHFPIAMARPTAGTTGGHVAAIYVLLGPERADQFFRDLHDHNVRLLGGNSVVADMVGRGTFYFGLTDNDDVESARENGQKVDLHLPDQFSMGTLMLPTTVGLVSGTQKTETAKKLIDYLLSQQVEQKLLDAKFVRWSVRKENDVKAMQVDYREVARVMPQAIRRATEILEGRDMTPSPSGKGPG
ncbi:MAG TPA: substrate-binding domain-containing protein [Tepidisphaeraceae bacterium]|nr:substrate-binding domain-containing protein [Tepidisphaeraceae bacterium]